MALQMLLVLTRTSSPPSRRKDSTTLELQRYLPFFGNLRLPSAWSVEGSFVFHRSSISTPLSQRAPKVLPPNVDGRPRVLLFLEDQLGRAAQTHLVQS